MAFVTLRADRRFFVLPGSGFDAQLAQLLHYLWPRHAQQDGVGALSRFVRAHAISSELEQAIQRWRTQSSPEANWALSHPPGSAYVRWLNIETLLFMAKQFGPSVSDAEAQEALAAFAGAPEVDLYENYEPFGGGYPIGAPMDGSPGSI